MPNALTSMNNPMIPGISGMAQGIFGDSGAPYAAAGDAYQQIMDKYLPGIQANFDPYINAGHDSLSKWQNSLSQMSNPQEFMDKIMGGYQESPWASFQRKYGQQGITNAASASGMLGSGALMKEAADYNQGLTSKDMQQYLSNVMGINKDYQAGQQGIAGMGLNGASSFADMMSRIIPGYAEAMGGSARGQEAGKSMDLGSLISGGLSFL